ncbi:MAG: TRAM domain-containing protein, partial [Candidatus Gracilibacteria bacterium]|nr:TRAM domain-containing protein [Candidatus Gracilibacteria bacterium]
FDFVYNARYSPRVGTLASKIYPDDISSKDKAKRWHKLNDTMEKVVKERNSLMIGKIEEIMITDKKGIEFRGRTRNFKEIVFNGNDKLKIGDLIKIKITELDKWVLKGEMI